MGCKFLAMKRLLLLIVLFCLMGTSSLFAQKERFKALFIFNFTKNIEWPAASRGNQFVIVVIGNSELIAELETIAQTQRVGNMPIKVVDYTNLENLNGCHLVYLSPSKSGMLSSLLTNVNGKHTLVVSDGKNLAVKGSGISFVQDGDKLKFEVSRKNIEKQGLKSSSALANLGIVVD